MRTIFDDLLATNKIRAQSYEGAGLSGTPTRHLAIVTCMDTRIDPHGQFGLERGDAHILRNAGGRASIDAIRSLVVSAHMLGTREVGVVHHTNCGLEGLTQAEVVGRTGVSDLDFLSFDAVEESVRADVEVLRGCGHLPAGFVVWGGVYDVDTGAIRLVAEPGPG